MKDIAKACGVSVVTVSRALKGDRNHSEKTREKVLRLATEMGYRTNPLVAALMSARGRHKPAKGAVNLALLNPGGEWSRHGFYRGAVEQAQVLGYSIEIFALEPAVGRGRLRKILQSRGVKGVIVLPAPEADWHLDLDLTGFAAATIGYSVVSPNMPRVVTDTYGRVREALNRAEQRGYRRIGVLGTDDHNRRFQHLSTAAVEVFRHLCGPQTTVLCLNLDAGKPGGVNAREVLAWVRQEKIDAVIGQYCGCNELRAAGLDIPGEIGYVNLHRIDDPDITCMDQNQEWIGRKATDVVVGMINRNEFKIPTQSQTIMIPSSWREGGTLPARLAGTEEAGLQNERM